MNISLIVGDIIERTDDAIVNAANEQLMAGGGVCGAIHAAAGPELETACRSLGPCPTGCAVITPGFRLKAKHVIHAVGPRWRGGNHGEEKLLEKCYASIYGIVKARGLKSIAIPAISTGIYGYPLENATEIALKTTLAAMPQLAGVAVTFVCFSDDVLKIYQKTLARLGADG